MIQAAKRPALLLAVTVALTGIACQTVTAVSECQLPSSRCSFGGERATGGASMGGLGGFGGDRP